LAVNVFQELVLFLFRIFWLGDVTTY